MYKTGVYLTLCHGEYEGVLFHFDGFDKERHVLAENAHRLQSLGILLELIGAAIAFLIFYIR